MKLIPKLIDKYQVPVGYSDHSGEIFSSLAAVALGASILEFHAVFHKKIFGPDSTSSLTIEKIKELVIGAKIELDLKNTKI